MKNVLKITTIGLLTLAVVGCNSKPEYKSANVTWVKQKAQDFKPSEALASLPKDNTNLVFFRKNDSLSKDTSVNISVNNRYQTSLHGGNYTVLPSCSGGTKVSTAVTMKLLNDLQYNKNVFDLAPAQNVYFEVSIDKMGNSQVSKVTEKQALMQIATKELQTHMVNRKDNQACAPYEKRTIDPVAVDDLKLFGAFYFDFDKSNLTPAEEQRIYNFGVKTQKMSKHYQIFLSGHADPMGQQEYNKALSKKRSIQVAKTLVKSGVTPSSIKLGSFGETQPVVLKCDGKQASLNRNECNLKNRRVEALVKFGAAK